MLKRFAFGMAAALACLLLAAPAKAVGVNCSSTSITALNQNAFSGTPTPGSFAQMSFSQGALGNTIYTGSDAKATMVSVEITGTWSGAPLYFQTTQDEQTSWQPLYMNTMGFGTGPSGFSTTLNGNWAAQVASLHAVRITPIQNGAGGTWTGTANVYMCIFTGAPGSFGGAAAQMQGSPFAVPLGGNIQQWNGANALLGPGYSMLPGYGATPRISLSRDANPRLIIDDSLPTFRCSANFTPQATAAVTMISLKGSATATVRVRKILLSGTSTALSVSVLALQRTTALGAGGTTVSPTIGVNDTNYGTGTALCSHYTTTLKAAGTASGGPLSTWTQFTDTATTPTVTSRSPDIVFPEGGVPGQAIILRGTSDFLEIQNVSPTNLGSGTVYAYTIEWTEDNS